MAEIIQSLTDGVVLKAPKQMSGPRVHRFKNEVMSSFEFDPRAIIIDFSEVDYIDLHGLVLFRDICDIIRLYGARAFAYKLSAQMRELLEELDIIEDLGDVESWEKAVRSA